MEGKLIPMRELRALAKRAGLELLEYTESKLRWSINITLWNLDANPIRSAVVLVEILGSAPTKRAAKVQARNNVWKFLECVLAMEYGEGE